MSCTIASRERVSRLKSVLFPTLGRPTRTTVGFIRVEKRTKETVPPAVCTSIPELAGTIAFTAPLPSASLPMIAPSSFERTCRNPSESPTTTLPSTTTGAVSRRRSSLSCFQLRGAALAAQGMDVVLVVR